MTIYIILFLFCFFFSFLADNAKNNRIRTLYLGTCVICMCIVGGFRDMGIGTDTLIYTEDYFNQARDYSIIGLMTDNLEYDKGYFLLNILTNYFSHDYWSILLMTQILSIGLTYWGAFRLSKHYPISFSIFTVIFYFVFYNQTYNYMRQFCALGILAVAFSYFIERKYLKYILLQFFAIQFHSSSALFAVVPVIYYINCHFNKKEKYLFIICFLGGSLWTVLNFYDILSYTANLGLYNTVYADRYSISSQYYGAERIPKYVILFNLFSLFIYVYAFIKKQIDHQLFLFCVVIHITYLIVYCLSLYVSYLIRLSFYFYYIDIFFIVYILSKKRIRKIVGLPYIILLLYCWYRLYIINNDCETYPYVSHILGV